ncbi:MAG: FtsW/RodA/SpoVE family cell cycle protein [Eubacteriales bacterium]
MDKAGKRIDINKPNTAVPAGRDKALTPHKAKKQNVKYVHRSVGSFDRPFFIIVILLLCFGSVMIFSSSYAYALWKYGDSYYFARRQIMWAVVGLTAVIITSRFITPELVRKFTIPFLVVTLALMYITPMVGAVTNGAKRWILIFGVSVQASELMKLALVLFMAMYIEISGDKMKTFTRGLLVPGFLLGITALAMKLQDHISGMLILMAIGIAMAFIGGASLKWIGILGGIVVAGATYIINFTEYATKRINMWRDPFAFPLGDGWQTIQSLYAIGSGGLLGVGLGQSRQKYLYLPEPQNDFIFSIVCEELGFIGAIALIGLFVLLVWRGVVIALRCTNKFASLTVLGIMIKVAIQTLLNLAVVTNSIPNTGISLPFFSYGGTSLSILMAEMGLVLAISKYSYIEK